MSRAALIVTVCLSLAAAALFALAPGLDIGAAAIFHRDGAFWGASQAARTYRYFFYYIPSVTLAVSVLAYLARKLGVIRAWTTWIDGRRIVFMLVSLILGPALIANIGFKQHWHRPRPYQVREFGGPYEFRPFWKNDGACPHNCSFMSGEVSTEAWLLAPASLAPPPVRAPAMALALIFTVLSAVGRLAFGHHFASDVIFAALMELVIVQALYLLIVARGVASKRPRR